MNIYAKMEMSEFQQIYGIIETMNQIKMWNTYTVVFLTRNLLRLVRFFIASNKQEMRKSLLHRNRNENK